MRVLHLSKFFPPVSGGIETVVHELADGLSQRGVDVRVICANTRARTEHDKSKLGYPVLRTASLGRLLSTSVAPGMLAQVRRASPDVDLIHVHMPDPMAALALFIADPTCKIVVHWHSDVMRQRIGLKLYSPLQRWLLQRADAIVCTSPAYAAASPWLQAWRDKLVVIPIGVRGLSPPSPDEEEAVRRRAGGRRVVFSLGRMTRYKGFDVLIDAAAMLRDDCVIIVGGDGDLLSSYRERVRQRGLSRQIQFVGHVRPEELGAYFSVADVFCLPSTTRAEAYGVVILEAMSLGKPVVATNIVGSGVPWVNQAGVTGLNVPINDAQALVRALNTILGDPGLARQMGASAKARFVAELNADSMVDNTLALYSKLCGQGLPSVGIDESSLPARQDSVT